MVILKMFHYYFDFIVVHIDCNYISTIKLLLSKIERLIKNYIKIFIMLWNFEVTKLTCYFQVEPIKISTGKWACPYCSKICTRGWLMSRHIKSHTGEKPYSCKFCPYSTIQKCNLKTHCLKSHGVSEDFVENK